MERTAACAAAALTLRNPESAGPAEPSLGVRSAAEGAAREPNEADGPPAAGAAMPSQRHVLIQSEGYERERFLPAKRDGGEGLREASGRQPAACGSEVLEGGTAASVAPERAAPAAARPAAARPSKSPSAAPLSVTPSLLAVGSLDRRIRLYSCASGGLLQDVPSSVGPVHSLCATPRRLMFGGAASIGVFDLQAQSELLLLEGHEAGVLAVGARWESRRALPEWAFSASEDGTARVWDFRTRCTTGNLLFRCTAGEHAFTAAVARPQDPQILLGDAAGRLFLWDLRVNRAAGFLQLPNGRNGVGGVVAADISPQGNLAAVSTLHGDLYFVRLDADRCEAPLGPAKHAALAAALAAADRWVAGDERRATVDAQNRFPEPGTSRPESRLTASGVTVGTASDAALARFAALGAAGSEPLRPRAASAACGRATAASGDGVWCPAAGSSAAPLQILHRLHPPDHLLGVVPAVKFAESALFFSNAEGRVEVWSATPPPDAALPDLVHCYAGPAAESPYLEGAFERCRRAAEFRASLETQVRRRCAGGLPPEASLCRPWVQLGLDAGSASAPPSPSGRGAREQSPTAPRWDEREASGRLRAPLEALATGGGEAATPFFAAALRGIGLPLFSSGAAGGGALQRVFQTNCLRAWPGERTGAAGRGAVSERCGTAASSPSSYRPWVWSLDVAEDESRLLGVTSDRRVQIWDLRSGCPLRTILSPPAAAAAAGARSEAYAGPTSTCNAWRFTSGAFIPVVE